MDKIIRFKEFRIRLVFYRNLFEVMIHRKSVNLFSNTFDFNNTCEVLLDFGFLSLKMMRDFYCSKIDFELKSGEDIKTFTIKRYGSDCDYVYEFINITALTS